MAAQTLREWMVSKGLTQAELARLLECSQPHVSDLLRGERRPSIHLAARIDRVTEGAIPVAAWVPLDGEAAA